MTRALLQFGAFRWVVAAGSSGVPAAPVRQGPRSMQLPKVPNTGLAACSLPQFSPWLSACNKLAELDLLLVGTERPPQTSISIFEQRVLRHVCKQLVRSIGQWVMLYKLFGNEIAHPAAAN